MTLISVTEFTLDDFITLTDDERRILEQDEEARRKLADYFVGGLADWDETARGAVEAWRERMGILPEPKDQIVHIFRDDDALATYRVKSAPSGSHAAFLARDHFEGTLSVVNIIDPGDDRDVDAELDWTE